MDTPYMPLDPAREEIRLLKIRRGAYNDDLIIDLHVSDYFSSPERGQLARYAALSYVWGSEISSRQALVNGKCRFIGHNLDCALRLFRAGVTGIDSPPFWIDAICINQDDVAERTQQVSLMKNIYRHAGTVLIWLGPEGPDDRLLRSCIENKSMRENRQATARTLRVLTEFCSRPWFQRVWVAQELALAHRDPFIVLGKAGFLLWSQFYEYLKTVTVKMHDSPLEDIHDWTRYLESSNRALKLGQLRDRPDYRWTMCQRMIETARCLATDPRDKVYGVLALLAPMTGLPTLIPDYSKTVQRVFAEATVYMIGEHTLLPHSSLPLRPPRIIDKVSRYHTVPGLPSWAIDFDISARTSTEWCKHYPESFVANGDYHIAWQTLRDTRHIPERVRISKSFDRLITWGAHIGTIAVTSGSALAMDAQNPLDLHDSQKRGTSLQNSCTAHLKPRGISDRVCLAALTTSGRLNIFKDARYRDLLEAGERREGLPPPFSDDIIEHGMMIERILFVSINNKMGAAYHYDLENGIRPG